MSSKKSDIKILVVNHKPSKVAENKLLKPIQVGSALADKKLDGMVYRDDEGSNISERNRSYCELTAVYWAWKNLDADYYGLFHYRRYLSFSNGQDDSPLAGKAFSDVDTALSEINLNETAMRDIIEANDLIVPRKDDTRNTTNDKSLYIQYEKEHDIKDLDYCLNYVRKNYPDIAPFTNTVHGSEAYFCNMFIMKKQLFNDYCTFMFDVLDAFEKNIDITGYNVHQYRVTGFLAERLTSIYIYYLKSLNQYKIKELQIAYFENTDPEVTLKPITNENNIAIVLAANNYYVPYISSLIHSISSHSSNEYTYDINIFHRDITLENMSILKKEFANYSNFHIRFYNISSRYEEYKNLFTRGHFAIETYFRLFIQDIMLDYRKVLYLDGDMVVNADVAELYQTNVEDHLLAASLDPDTAGLYNGFEPQKKNYMDNILKIQKPYEYFQAGVILFNLDEMRKTLEVKKLIEFASSYEWELLDQDVLNYIAQGKTKYLDMAWNVMYDWRRIRLTQIVALAPIKLYLDYVKARKNPKIIHYAGPEKPWHEPDCDYGTYYWVIARKSIFYEQIVARMTDWRASNLKSGKLRLRSRIVRKLRKIADRVAPKGTALRKPLTMTSVFLKKLLR